MQRPGSPQDVDAHHSDSRSPADVLLEPEHLMVDMTAGPTLTLEDYPPEALATEFALALFDFVCKWATATSRQEPAAGSHP